MAYNDFKLDKRNLYKHKKANGQEIITKRIRLDTFYYNFLEKNYFNIEYSGTINQANVIHHIVPQKSLQFFAVYLRGSLLNNFFFNDVGVSLLRDTNTITYNFSCLVSQERVAVTFFKKKNFFKKTNYKSLSNIFLSSQWAERELQELNNIYFMNLSDSRRLMTDYFLDNTIAFNDYKLDSYDTIIQDIYKWMLH